MSVKAPMRSIQRCLSLNGWSVRMMKPSFLV
jgi:hypothetical protein